MGGWVGWWPEKMKIEQSSASARLKLAELGNTKDMFQIKSKNLT